MTEDSLVNLVASELQRVNNQAYVDQAKAVIRVINEDRERVWRTMRENFNKRET